MRQGNIARHEPEINDSGDKNVDEGSLWPRWLALLTGVIMACVMIALFVGIAGLVIWFGVGFHELTDHDRRIIAVYAVLCLVGSIAISAWFAGKKTDPGGTLWMGPIISIVVVLGIFLIAYPFAAPVADFRSVAIALDWIDAPNVGTRPSEALHRLVEAQKDNGGSAEPVLPDARADVRDTGWFLGALLIALLLAGFLGAASGARTRARSMLSLVTGQLAAYEVVALAGAIALITARLWLSVWSVTVAVVDFDQSAGPDIGVDLSEVAEHPQVMLGKTVTVSAKVGQILNSHAAILGQGETLVGNRVLIVSESTLQEQVLLSSTSGGELSDGDVVQVTGVVRLYQPELLESVLGITLQEDALASYEIRGVMVVKAIDLDVPPASEAGDKEFGGGSAGYDYGITIDDIDSNAQEYVGLTVTVSDEVEEGGLTPHAFFLGDPHLLCVSASPRPELFVEATAYVTGTVMIFDIDEFEQMLGIELSDQHLADHEGEPVILVESVVLVK